MMTRLAKWLGLALGLGLCAYFLARMDWPAFYYQLRSLHALPVAGMLVAVILSTLGRAVRWRMLTIGEDPDGREGSKHGVRLFWRAVVIGYLGNYVYPARAGELLRIAWLHKLTALPAAQVLTTSVIDRGLDVLVLAGCALTLTWLGLFAGETQGIQGSLLYLAGGIGVAMLGLTLLLRFDTRLRAMACQLLTVLRLPGRERCNGWLGQVSDALGPLRSPRVLAVAGACSVGVVFLDVLAVWMLVLAFDWGLPFTAGLTLYVFLSLGAALPSAPGYLGIYQAVSVLVLGMYGVPEAGALAFAFTLQGLSLCLFLGLGAVTFSIGR